MADGDKTDKGVPERIAKLESDVGHIKVDVAEIKGDLREMRRDNLAIRSEARTDFRLLFGAIITVGIGMAGLIAKSAHWL